LYSNASFVLGPGSHSITINVTQNALDTVGGAGVFSVSAVPAVPAPATWLLVGSGLVSFGLAIRRRLV